MMNPGTLLLTLTTDFTVKIGIPPRDCFDGFNSRSSNLGKARHVSHIACSPDGELFCIQGEDLYRGPMPSKKDADWFSVARRVGRAEWSRIKLLFFHPNGDMYCSKHNGEFYKGPQPENEHVPWMYEQAQKIGRRFWNEFDALFFNREGILHGVHSNDCFYKGSPPTDENYAWMTSSTKIRNESWRRLTHFMSFDTEGKLWCVDKYNGNIYRGDPPETEFVNYIVRADYLGWNYNMFQLLSFTKDKTIRTILSLEFLTDEGEKVSEHPEVLGEKIYDNRKSSSTMNHTFVFKKTIKETSSFTHEHGFSFEMGSEITYTSGIPFISEGSMQISMNMSTTHNWSFEKTNETEVTFSSSSNVSLEAGKAIKMVASMTKAEIDVPYKARVRTLFGFKTEIRGMWKGVSHYHLIFTQKDYKK